MNALTSYLQACFGALGMHLAERYEQFVGPGGGANRRGKDQPEHGCERIWKEEALQLPDFPDIGEGFDFTLPPIPRLLPSQQYLQSLLPAEEPLGQHLLQRQRNLKPAKTMSIGVITGAVVGALFASMVWALRMGVQRHKGRIGLRYAAHLTSLSH